ncbi:swi5-dependent recombination DNA repair protein 1 homolog [Boleophthalmus pectinirostris]|uniref:swi5-dependent recombination DNA repair protein 1 homolog n=1 Tax=Boleophthalmus pectinirostris TaxID=150288 RepID=UPI000A1C6C12|nr:swi5-dependent recombination DNA repair protein 1 homolog [Boleophthalmus pectinirostris]
MEITPKATTKFKSVYSTPEETGTGDISPSVSSAEKSHHKLSASLRERLKRCRRSFTSPICVAKRLCVDEEEDEVQPQQVPTTAIKQTVNNPPLNRNVLSSNNAEGCCSIGPISEPCLNLTQQLEQLKKEVKDKTETLRRLKMVKMYRSKNNLTQLQSLIDKWRSCAQAALYELQSEVTQDGKKASLSELIDLFGLEDNILHFDRTEEDFTT